MEQLPAIITKARARLLIRVPFIGSIALGLRWINDAAIGTMATDGRHVWFNTAWCESHGVEKTMGVIAHEVYHVVLEHHLRRGERDAQLWNIAADLLINRLLEEDKFVLPPDGLFDRERAFAGLTTETIYARLTEQQQQSQKPQQQQEDSQGASNPGTSNDPNPGGQPSSPAAGKDAPVQDQNATPAEQGTGAARQWGEVRDLTKPDGKPLTAGERSRAEHELDVRIRQAAAGAKRAGKLRGTVQEIIEVATDRVDWQDKLRIIFDGTLRGEADWARPNRRFIQAGIYLPGWRRTGAGRVAFVLDTSGSISEAELSVYTAAVLGLLEETSPESVALIQCDTEVRHVEYLQAGDSFDRITVHGRGGTRFQPAFDWIEESGLAPCMIIYATDLIVREIPQDPGRPVIWLTPSHGRKMPFGEIIHVSA
jgi:predicted metal-dependent peptidase